jgi:hypothetical protein
MTPYPLAWPEMMPRCKVREGGQFRTTLASAIQNVKGSLALFAKDSGKALTGLVISSNVTLGANNPSDPGVAVWFTWDGLSVCIPVDRYTKVESNLQAIHHIIEARRVELRHGTLALVRASFTGFAALPAPGKRNWRAVLGIAEGFPVTKAVIESFYRDAARRAHPDTGGSNAAMAEVNDARTAALKELA